VYTRECPAIEIGQSSKVHDVVLVLQRIIQQRGAPQVLFCDNGSEFASRVMDSWTYYNQVKIDFSLPGKPTDNAYVESFNGPLRGECIDAHWFGDPNEAIARIETWRREHIESRPHRALGERERGATLICRTDRGWRDLSCSTTAGG
jgi:putative transposase